MQERAKSALKDILAENTVENQDRVVVITAHGGILRALLSYILHMPTSLYLGTPSR